LAEDLGVRQLRDRELAEVIDRYGRDMARVYGWIARVLSFPEKGCDRALDIVRLIQRAESAWRRRFHDQMVGSRKELMEQDSDAFSVYMARIG